MQTHPGSLQAEGGCLCRAVRYRVTGAPLSSIICHCQSCRRASAAPSVAWLTFEAASFEVLSGELRNFRSSPGVTRRFCAVCGSPITYENDRDTGSIDVTTASLDDPNRFPPAREVWLEHKIAWEATNGTLDQFPRGGGGGAQGNQA
ncbi:MAG TPA: GFA family protein [Burkholderiales bacterium]|nr:GFA family protein [Burkholderiales bacterium]